MNLFQKLHFSIFTKLLIVFCVAYFILISLIFYSHRELFRLRIFPQVQKNSINYGNLLIDRLGTPPDTLLARQWADSLNIRMRIQGPGLHWQSAPGMPEVEALSLSRLDNYHRVRAGFHHGLYVQIERAGYRFLFNLESREEGFQFLMEVYVAIVILLSTIIIFGAFFIIRRLLRPIAILKSGVHELSAGNLDYKIFTRQHDELGDLIHSFNSMAERLKEMIQAREKFLLDVSHELRSPLTRIKVAMEFLDESSAKKNISDDIVQMETMLAELLESGRLNSPHGGLKKERINLAEVIRLVVAASANVSPGIKLLPLPDEIWLELDEKRIRTLFNNVLMNALKYSDQNKIPVEVSAREGENTLVVTIQDFGIGIPEEDLPFIFEPFYRVDKSRSKETGGYGLGMSLSKKIMEAHNGSIEVSSKPGTGTTVYLKFKK